MLQHGDLHETVVLLGRGQHLAASASEAHAASDQQVAAPGEQRQGDGGMPVRRHTTETASQAAPIPRAWQNGGSDAGRRSLRPGVVRLVDCRSASAARSDA